MAYDWVKKALDNVSADMKKELAAELGVKPGNLINVSRPNVVQPQERTLRGMIGNDSPSELEQ